MKDNNENISKTQTKAILIILTIRGKIAAVHHNMKCYSGHLMKIPVFFHIAIYIAGFKKIAMYVFSNIVQLYSLR